MVRAHIFQPGENFETLETLNLFPIQYHYTFSSRVCVCMFKILDVMERFVLRRYKYCLSARGDEFLYEVC